MNPADPHLRPHRADRLPDLFAPAVVDLFAGAGGLNRGIDADVLLDFANAEVLP